MRIYDKGKHNGFLSMVVWVSFAVLALPCLALGAGRTGGSTGASTLVPVVSVLVRGVSTFRVRLGGNADLHDLHVVDFFGETDSLTEMVE